MVLAASAVQAQTQVTSAPGCTTASQPDYGFESIDCINCEISGRGQPWIVFHNPPVVRGIRNPGPAAGKLQEGDTLVWIDGLAITSPQGAKRYAEAAVGDSATFAVRRASGSATVTVVAGSRCEPGTKFAWTWASRPAYLARVRPLTATLQAGRVTWNIAPVYFRRGGIRDSVAAPGWIGIAVFRVLRTAEQLRAETGTTRWISFGDSANVVFQQPPEIAAVAPGSPADSAGITAGDTLVAVDGISVLTPDGARRFLNAPAGVALQLMLRRGGSSIRVRVVPKEPPDAPPEPSYAIGYRDRE
jgi:S1-C subfamily serine protease